MVIASIGPVVAGDDLAVGERAVRFEIHVRAGVEALRFADVQRPRCAMRAFRQNNGAGGRLDRRHGRRMVAMGVGDKNMRHGLAAHRIEQRRDVRRIVRAGIDDRDLAAPDDVAQRTLERERARIVGQNAPHAGRAFLRNPGARSRRSVKLNIFGHWFSKTPHNGRAT